MKPGVRGKAEDASRKLFWCLFSLYTVNILGKMSFTVVTASLIDEAVLTKTQAGLINGVFWLLYALGQFAGGVLINRSNPYSLIKLAAASSMLANLLMAFEDNFTMMFVTWGINGVLQFGLWPAILRLISTQITREERGKATDWMAFCYCLGCTLSYLLSLIILAAGDYRYMFLCCSIVTGITLLAIIYAERRLAPLLGQKEAEVQANWACVREERITWQTIWGSGLFFFCLMTVVKSMVDNGIKNWMPTILLETYAASPSFGSLLSVGLLLTNFLGVVLTTWVYHKVKCNELAALLILYVPILPMFLLLSGMGDIGIYFCTALMSGITILVYGSEQIFLLNYPGRFGKWGLTATAGGILNCFSALGNVAATYGNGYIADRLGWDAVIWFWMHLILLSVGIMLALIPLWRKFCAAKLE